MRARRVGGYDLLVKLRLALGYDLLVKLRLAETSFKMYNGELYGKNLGKDVGGSGINFLYETRNFPATQITV